MRHTTTTTASALAFALTLLVSLAGCPRAPVGVENVELPADSANQCQSQCGRVGLRMQSLVIMANYVGCVCSPSSDSDRPSADGASGAAGGLAAILVLQQQQEAAQQQQQQQAQQAAQQQQ